MGLFCFAARRRRVSSELLFCYTSGMRKHEFEAFFKRHWERLGLGAARPPRVTDDGEGDGLTGAPIPRKPIAPVSSGAASLAIPVGTEDLKLP